MAPQPIYAYSEADTHRIYAWARYVFYTEVECEQYNAHEKPEGELALGRTLVLMMQFYAGLWVAIDGWRETPLADETVDELLTDPAFQQNMELLRRFRNGVYHYQPQQINERVLAFLRDGSEHAVLWAFLVHDEFKRIVWQLAHPPELDSSRRQEFADGLKGVIGWLPSDPPEGQPLRATEQCREVLEMLRKAGSQNTPQARDLLDAVSSARAVAYSAEAGWPRKKRAMIEALKKMKRDL